MKAATSRRGARISCWGETSTVIGHPSWSKQGRSGLLATAAGASSSDVWPKGDPAGRIPDVIDDTTIAPAATDPAKSRPGNRRVNGYKTVPTNRRWGQR
jgi:hypothetical protein